MLAIHASIILNMHIIIIQPGCGCRGHDSLRLRADVCWPGALPVPQRWHRLHRECCTAAARTDPRSSHASFGGCSAVLVFLSRTRLAQASFSAAQATGTVSIPLERASLCHGVFIRSARTSETSSTSNRPDCGSARLCVCVCVRRGV